MENFALPDWLKICLSMIGGCAAWGLVLWFSKEWFNSAVIDEIKELKEEAIAYQEEFRRFYDRINSFVFKIASAQNDLSKSVTKEINDMSKTLIRSEENSKVFASVADKLNARHKYIESEILKIAHDLIMIRDKK